MKLYHYTKGNRLNSIFTDGFIATEGKGELCSAAPITDYVWMTEKARYPKTALPYISFMPETNLLAHIGRNAPFVDLDKLGQIIGGAFRFSFDSSDARFKKWWFSDERKVLQNNIYWRRMESVANKVGDDVRSFWIAFNDVELTNFSLEVFGGGSWKSVLNNVSLCSASDAELTIINGLRERSKEACEEYGLPAVRTKVAA